MKIIIIGAGTVGFGLAQHLSELEHHITIVDQNKSLCDEINSKLDVFVINGLGSSPSILEEAGIQSADMIIAVTPSDETNLLACNFAMQNNVTKRIARVKSNIYTKDNSCIDLNKLGISHIIEPEKEIMQKIVQYIELPGVSETANFESNNIYLRGYKVTEDMPIANKTLAEIKPLSKTSPMLFVVIIRNNESLPPTGEQKILPGDDIVVIMPKESFKTFRNLINRKAEKIKKIIISGDSLTAIHLAQALQPICEHLLFVNPRLEHGKMAASLLNGIEVLHGDCTDSQLLQEINAGNTDFFIAAGKDTEDNIMSCLLAKNEGASKTIAIRSDDRHSSLFHSLGIDHIITPEQTTLNSIIEKIQTVSLGSYLKLKTADIGIVRLKAEKDSPVIEKSLKDLYPILKRFVIIGCIIRENSVIIPEGNTIIKENDELIVLSNKKHIESMTKIFAPNLLSKLKSLAQGKINNE